MAYADLPGLCACGAAWAKLQQMARFLSMQMTSSLPTESMVNDDDDDELSYDLEDAHNFRSAGAYGSTYDHNIDIDSDEDNDDEGHMVRTGKRERGRG